MYPCHINEPLPHSLSRSSFQSKVLTLVCVMGGKGGWAILQVLGGGGAGVRAMEPRLVEARVERDIRDIEDTQPGEERPAPPILELGVGEPRPLSSSSSSTTSSSMATLQYGTCRGHQYEQIFLQQMT